MSDAVKALEMGRPNLEVFAETVTELARRDSRLLAVTSDSRGSGKLKPFGQERPDQIVEVGIAEQNLVGIAAGLASTDRVVFAVSPACFLTTRALEQIKNDVCYSDMPVNLIGISAGVSYGPLGSTHHSLHDIAALRAIHNIDVVVPADNFETREAIRAAAAADRPVYVRLGKKAMRHLHGPETEFEIGRAITVREEEDVAFVATGETVETAVEAAALLERDGVSCRVVSMHTVKPLDVETLLSAASRRRALITVEEHSVHGGLGEACAGALMREGVAVKLAIVGIPDEDTFTGSQMEIYAHYGITGEGLAERARRLLG